MHVRTESRVRRSRATRLPARPGGWVTTLADERRQLVRYWPVVHSLVLQDLRVRYHRSLLGFCWTLLNPVLMMTTMALVFSQFFHVKNYAVYLFAGMVPWSFLSGCLNDCAFSFILNEGLIRKVYVPKLVFPLSRVLINLTTFVLSMAALFLLLKPLGARFTLPLLLLPVVVVLFALFAFGLGLIVATGNTFFRDWSHLMGVFLQAWYFATPILYEWSSCSARGQRLFWLNPAFPFVRLFQVILHDGEWPSARLFAAAAGTAAVCLGVGYVVYKGQEDKLVFRL
jgi:ABC-2 type transport system permease protein/lipopolysaccharide transport system permease protein